MKLPNDERAVADIGKFRDYCLNAEHPVGKHKARVFKSSLGFTKDDAEKIRDIVMEAAKTEDAIEGDKLPLYGQTYTLDFITKGLHGDVKVRTPWIVEIDTDFPRLTTCYVIE